MVLPSMAIKMVLTGQDYGLQIRAFLASAKPEKIHIYSSSLGQTISMTTAVARMVMSSSPKTISIP